MTQSPVASYTRGQTDLKKSHPKQKEPYQGRVVSPVIKPQQHQTFFSGTLLAIANNVPRCLEIAVPRPGWAMRREWSEAIPARKVVARLRGLDGIQRAVRRSVLPAGTGCSETIPPNAASIVLSSQKPLVISLWETSAPTKNWLLARLLGKGPNVRSQP